MWVKPPKKDRPLAAFWVHRVNEIVFSSEAEETVRSMSEAVQGLSGTERARACASRKGNIMNTIRRGIKKNPRMLTVAFSEEEIWKPDGADGSTERTMKFNFTMMTETRARVESVQFSGQG